MNFDIEDFLEKFRFTDWKVSKLYDGWHLFLSLWVSVTCLRNYLAESLERSGSPWGRRLLLALDSNWSGSRKRGTVGCTRPGEQELNVKGQIKCRKEWGAAPQAAEEMARDLYGPEGPRQGLLKLRKMFRNKGLLWFSEFSLIKMVIILITSPLNPFLLFYFYFKSFQIYFG